jgi:hypothetical protein
MSYTGIAVAAGTGQQAATAAKIRNRLTYRIPYTLSDEAIGTNRSNQEPSVDGPSSLSELSSKLRKMRRLRFRYATAVG